MMDGRVAAIRGALDGERLSGTAILAYSAKFASAFYGPFRDAAALGAAVRRPPRLPDGSGQRARGAARGRLLDVAEGADMVMVKPALPYLDVLRRVRETTQVPVAAYQVSGEYAMIEAAAAQGLIDRAWRRARVSDGDPPRRCRPDPDVLRRTGRRVAVVGGAPRRSPSGCDREAGRLIPGGVNVAGAGVPLGRARASAVHRPRRGRLASRTSTATATSTGCMSWGPLIAGHAHPAVVEAIQRTARSRHVVRRADRARGRAGARAVCRRAARSSWCASCPPAPRRR